ncbi:outer membrane protein assembly factor BamD [bacterium]|nr:outer membrane protein assembly factor BamD [bacterium]
MKERKSRQFAAFCMGFILFFAAAGCHRETVNWRKLSNDELFLHAKKLYDRKDWFDAKTHFTTVLLGSPAGNILEQAQYLLGDCHFQLKEYVEAIAEFEKVIKSMPNGAYADDARFKIGLCYDRLAPGYALDQDYTYKAIAEFEAFLDEFPQSEFYPEAERKLKSCRDRLAKKEYKTGELYRKMGYYPAAIISFQSVEELYADTEYSDDAVYWRAECLRKMGSWEDAAEAYEKLLNVHPDSPLFAKARLRLKSVREKARDSGQEPQG